MSGLYISAAHKSSGKTTVALGLCRALERRGLKVQPYKKGPDYIDPIWHSQAARRPCYNLDFNLMSGAEIDALYARHALGADLALVEGNKGLYDGMDLHGSNSNAALAKRLGLPVVLVVDTSGITRGIAPLLLGYRAFDSEVDIAGIILNKVGGPRHEDKLRQVVAHYTGIPVLGAIHKHAALAIVERHLGLIPGNEIDEAETRIDAIADIVGDSVDLDALMTLARRAAVPMPVAEAPRAYAGGVRLGIAQDRVFGFYYQEDLDTLRAGGVDLVKIDTLRDTALPDIDALLIGGGFPEAFIAELSANSHLMADIRRQADAGLPIYAECGGLMYLSRSLRWGDAHAEMVGLLPGDTVMGERPVGRGYASLRQAHPGPLGEAMDAEIPAHEFHYSRIENLAPNLNFAYAVTRGQGIDGDRDGYIRGNLIAAYCHRRGSGPHGWIAPLVELARQRAEQRRATRLAA